MQAGCWPSEKTLKLIWPQHSRKKQCKYSKAASGTKSDSNKEQIEEFIRHKQEALGCKRLKAISAAKGSFVLKHTTKVNCHVSE
jgi:hypothetical protein